MPFINFNTQKKVQVWEGITGTISHSEQATYCHFTIENGAVLPEHQHVHEQWTHVLDGLLEFDIDGEKMLLTSGMTAFIPSNVPHSGRAFAECKVIDCFTPVREDFKLLTELPESALDE